MRAVNRAQIGRVLLHQKPVYALREIFRHWPLSPITDPFGNARHLKTQHLFPKRARIKVMHTKSMRLVGNGFEGQNFAVHKTTVEIEDDRGGHSVAFTLV